MTPKFPAASKLVVLLAAAAVVAVSATSASAQTKRQQQYDKDGRPYYGANGPNRAYQQGPNTRVYVTTRSWLDAGTEVLAGRPQIPGLRVPAAVSGIHRSRARTTTARSTASRSTRRRIWADIRGTSRCIGDDNLLRRCPLLTKMPGLDRAFFMTSALYDVCAYACSVCSSFRIASPICVVLTAVVPSDLMSAVRRPLASTAAIAASTLSASAPMSKE